MAKWAFSVRDKGRANSAGITSPDFLNDDKWHLLAGVRDQKAKKIRFYIDGELIDEVDDNTKDINSGQSIWVGEHLNRFYKGLIDEVKVWNRPLTAAELEQSGKQPSSVDASWKVNDRMGCDQSDILILKGAVFGNLLAKPGAVPNRTISVNFRKNNRLRPRTGRFGLQPNRILRGNLEDSKKLL